ncbi:hypothetical protein FD754_022903, partial [Muntiacus muntjak]
SRDPGAGFPPSCQSSLPLSGVLWYQTPLQPDPWLLCTLDQGLPSRSVQETLSHRPGGAVVSSELAFDQFHLLREGENLGRLLDGGRGPRGALPAEFPLGPGTPAHSGAYRCYGSFTRSPYRWSDPSDPLLLSVAESTTSTCPSTMNPHTTEEAKLPQGHSSQLHLLLRLSIAFIYTSIFLTVLPNCHWCSTQIHKSEGGKDNIAIMEGEAKEDRAVNSEDSPAEDVIYTPLDHGTLSERLFIPTPLSPMHLSADPSIYEEFDVNQDHAEP